MEVNYHNEIKEFDCRLLVKIPCEKPLDGRLEEPGRHHYKGFLIVLEPLSGILLGHQVPPRTKDGKCRILPFREVVKGILRGYPPFFHLLRHQSWWGWSDSLVEKILESRKHYEGLLRFLDSSEKRTIAYQRKAIFLAQMALGGFSSEDYLREPEAFPDLLAHYRSCLNRKIKSATDLPREEIIDVLELCYRSTSSSTS